LLKKRKMRNVCIRIEFSRKTLYAELQLHSFGIIKVSRYCRHPGNICVGSKTVNWDERNYKRRSRTLSLRWSGFKHGCGPKTFTKRRLKRMWNLPQCRMYMGVDSAVHKSDKVRTSTYKKDLPDVIRGFYSNLFGRLVLGPKWPMMRILRATVLIWPRDPGSKFGVNSFLATKVSFSMQKDKRGDNLLSKFHYPSTYFWPTRGQRSGSFFSLQVTFWCKMTWRDDLHSDFHCASNCYLWSTRGQRSPSKKSSVYRLFVSLTMRQTNYLWHTFLFWLRPLTSRWSNMVTGVVEIWVYIVSSCHFAYKKWPLSQKRIDPKLWPWVTGFYKNGDTQNTYHRSHFGLSTERPNRSE